jgi:hypothetical protein
MGQNRGGGLFFDSCSREWGGGVGQEHRQESLAPQAGLLGKTHQNVVLSGSRAVVLLFLLMQLRAAQEHAEIADGFL